MIVFSSIWEFFNRMLRDVLTKEPPRLVPQETGHGPVPFPTNLRDMADADISAASDQRGLYSAFLAIQKHLKREIESKDKYDLIVYALSAVEPSMFDAFVDSNLAECVTFFLQQFLAPDLKADKILMGFLSRNIVPFVRNLQNPVVLKLQHMIIQGRLESCEKLLKAIYAARSLRSWVAAQDRNPYALKLILDAVMPAQIDELPLECSTEIARCLIVCALLLRTMNDIDLRETCCALVRCIARFLKYAPIAFANPSTVYCLQQVATEKVIAAPLLDVRNHPGDVSIDSVLQLVRFSLFARLVRDKAKLLDIASICPAACVEVLTVNHAMFHNDPNAMKFLTTSLAVESVAPYAEFESIPEDLLELAIFLHSKSAERLKTKAMTRYVGQILHLVCSTIKENAKGSTNVSVLIGAAKIMSYFIGFDQPPFPTHQFRGFSAVTPHFYYAACLVADAIVASPLYPHQGNKTPISFQLKAAFLDLAGVLANKPKDFLAYLLNSGPKPGRILLLASAIESATDAAAKQWGNAVRVNLPDILKCGMAILKVPTEITSMIAARFYSALLTHTLKMGLPRLALVPILMTPIELTAAIGHVSFSVEEITDASAILHYLGFLERILDNNVLKTFIILHAQNSFWHPLFTWIDSKIVKLAARVSARVFRIFAKLSDFANSMRPRVVGGQRLIFDVLYHGMIARICDELGNITSDGLGIQEKGDLAISVLQLLLSWCDPLPVAAFVSSRVTQDMVKNFVEMGVDAGDYFKKITEELESAIVPAFRHASETGDVEELASTQETFIKGRAVVERLTGLFFTLLKYQVQT